LSRHQAVLYACGEVFQPADEEKKFLAACCHFTLFLDLSLQSDNPLFGALNPRRELLFLNQTLPIAIDKPPDCLVHLADLRLQKGKIFV
jgi:hypothetical protein